MNKATLEKATNIVRNIKLLQESFQDLEMENSLIGWKIKCIKNELKCLMTRKINELEIELKSL